MPLHASKPVKQDPEADSIRLMLDTVEFGGPITQRSLAAELGLGLGHTDIYLKGCLNKGHVKVCKAPTRHDGYYMASKGSAEATPWKFA